MTTSKTYQVYSIQQNKGDGWTDCFYGDVSTYAASDSTREELVKVNEETGVVGWYNYLAAKAGLDAISGASIEEVNPLSVEEVVKCEYRLIRVKVIKTTTYAKEEITPINERSDGEIEDFLWKFMNVCLKENGLHAIDRMNKDSDFSNTLQKEITNLRNTIKSENISDIEIIRKKFLTFRSFRQTNLVEIGEMATPEESFQRSPDYPRLPFYGV